MRDVLDFVKWKIRDLNQRKKKVLIQTSAWAMDMSIKELKEVKEFIELQRKDTKNKQVGKK